MTGKKKKIKKKISILFIIFREEKIGHKDIDHFLPLLYFLSKSNKININAKGLIFSNEISFKNSEDPRLKLFQNLKNIELEFLHKDNFLFKLKNFLEFNIHSPLGIFNRVINKLYLKLLKKINKKIYLDNNFATDFIKSDSLLIATLHSNPRAQKIVSLIKKRNKKSKWMVFPDGTTICDNKMVVDSHLSKHENNKKNKNFDEIDYFFTSSKRDLADLISSGLDSRKGSVIGSPRYCKDWLKIKSKIKLDGKDVKINKSYKVKALFLIPKGFINIFNEELIRTIDFISSYKEIELILLNNNSTYPKIPSYIANRINIRRYLVAKQYSTSKLIEWADIVFHAGTGVIFESFMKDKITVLPRYLSSNTFISDKYNAGFNLRNRDELRNLCNTAVKSLENLKRKYQKETNSSNKKFINDYVYGNLKSVPKNLIKYFK